MSDIDTQRHDHTLTLGAPRPEEAEQINRLLQAAVPDCIPMPADEIRARLDEFQVARDCHGRVVGSVAVRPLGELRAELRGVVIHRCCRGSGLGSRLVWWAICQAATQGRQLVCVTRSPGFFQALGFREIPLSWVPEKPARPLGNHDGRRRVAMAWDVAVTHQMMFVEEVQYVLQR